MPSRAPHRTALAVYGGPGAGANIGKESGPLALYNASGATITISPLSGFMTAQLAHANIVNDTDGCIASGHNGMVTDVPAGWTYETVIVAGSGVNSTVMAWGDVLLARSGKTRTKADADVIISTLGWWTDNGACWHARTQQYPRAHAWDDHGLGFAAAALRDDARSE